MKEEYVFRLGNVKEAGKRLEEAANLYKGSSDLQFGDIVKAIGQTTDNAEVGDTRLKISYVDIGDSNNLYYSTKAIEGPNRGYSYHFYRSSLELVEKAPKKQERSSISGIANRLRGSMLSPSVADDVQTFTTDRLQQIRTALREEYGAPDTHEGL